MTTIPQIILFLDANANFHAEMVGANGSRRKLDLRDGLWEPTLRAELVQRALTLRDSEREAKALEASLRAQRLARLANERAERIYHDVARKHGLGLANKVIPGRAQRKAQRKSLMSTQAQSAVLVNPDLL